MMPNVIEVRNGTKKFKHVTTLKDVSITFEQGKIHGSTDWASRRPLWGIRPC